MSRGIARVVHPVDNTDIIMLNFTEFSTKLADADYVAEMEELSNVPAHKWEDLSNQQKEDLQVWKE